MNDRNLTRTAAALAMALTISGHVSAQETAAPGTPPPPASTAAPEEEEGEMIVLSPFEVTASTEKSYTEATTLAGNRLNTELRDVGNAVSVVNSQFLRDVGATNNETLLQYTPNTEVGSIQGNFAGLGDGAALNENNSFKNPNQNTRVRGLAAADNARDYFLTDIPWDSFNVDRIDLQRGPNSIMFGQGSPAGLINASTQPAAFKNSGEVDFRVGSYGSVRGSLNLNRVILKDELAVRFAVVRDDQKFKQKPAFDDSERLYGAVRYEPAFLKKGSARTIFKASIEDGNVDSNRPRSLPPIDQLTPWFYTGSYTGRAKGDGNGNGNIEAGELDDYTYQNLNKLTVNPHQAMNDNLYRPGHGVGRPLINGGPMNGQNNPSFNPWVGEGRGSIGQSPLGYFTEAGATTASSWWSHEIVERGGIAPSGAIDDSIAYDFNRAVTVAPTSVWAKSANYEFAEIYKNNVLTDPSIYNFYNNLLDGNNKREWQDWNTFNISLAQTFLNDKMGVELNYYAETYRNGQTSIFSDGSSIRIDMMSVEPDGTNLGTGTPPDNLPFGDGTPNPNVGRAFVTTNGAGGNNSYLSDRVGKRATAFITHDFEKEGSGSTLSKILGKHTLTGLLASEEQEKDIRNWNRYAILDPGFRSFLRTTADQKWTVYAPSALIYIGPSMMNASSASGAKLSRVKGKIDMSGTHTVRAFDTTWAPAAGVDPAAEWFDNAYIQSAEIDAWYAADSTRGRNPYYKTESENPANYVGWTNTQFVVTDSEDSQANRDLLSTSAELGRNLNDSKALVWQGKMFGNALVGTYGWREDDGQAWSYSQSTNDRPAPGHLDLSPEVYRLPSVEDGEAVAPSTIGRYTYNRLNTVTSRAWSAVLHLEEVYGLKRFAERLPFNVSLLYARSTNFQPLASRVDAYGEAIAAPEGKTREAGILIESKDGKYTFKANNYKTRVKNASSSAISQAWFIGSSQAWAGNWVNQFQYNRTNGNISSARPEPQRADYTNDADWQTAWDAWDTNSQWNYAPATEAEGRAGARARENAAIAAWRAWQASVDPRFYEAWGIDLGVTERPGAGEIGASLPAGFAIPEDNESKGWEFELSAMPARNWRVSLNATRTVATRKNIGGAALSEFINSYEDAIKNTPAGDLRIWWGGAGNETTLFQWNQRVGFEWTSRKLQEGSAAPEIRKWRFNAITTYDFTEGRLNGLSVGAGVRYQDKVVIGYQPVGTSSNFSVDLNSPYYGPAETNFDFWIGYGRRFADKIDWRIQLNVRNAFEGNDLIPITVQPDGTPAAYRIAPSQTWTISNTFRF